MTDTSRVEFSAFYRNWRGEIRWRILIPISIWFGSTEWHKQEQWFLKATDTQTGDIKDFALADFLGDQEGEKDTNIEDWFKELSRRADNLGYQLISNEQASILGSSVSVGNGLQVYGDIAALVRVQQYIMLNSNHSVESADVKQILLRDLHAAEARELVLQNRLSEMQKLLETLTS